MKKSMKKNKLPLIALSSLLVVGLVAGTLAAFTTNYEVKNLFKVGTADSKFVEEFDAPTTDIVYGESFNKTGKVYNLGDTDVYAKATITTTWTGWGQGTAGVLSGTVGADAVFAATLDFGATAKITETSLNGNVAVKTDPDVSAAKWVFDATDSCFYYGAKDAQTPIAGGTTSEQLLKSVTFADNDLVATADDGKYYIASQWDAVNNAPTTGATAYDSQAEAIAASKASTELADQNGKIYFLGQKAYTHPNYKGQLEVTIACALQDTAF